MSPADRDRLAALVAQLAEDFENEDRWDFIEFDQVAAKLRELARLLTAEAAPVTTLADFAERRASHHATFNGGWEAPDARRAFHHGMDTVFNCIDAEVKGERRQA